MSTSGIADAVRLEAAWLTTSGDGLPALLTEAGGPWDTIQAYAPRTPSQQKTQIYVLRRRVTTQRFGQQRRMATHHLVLALVWPIGATTIDEYLAEDEQAAFDAALDLLIQRIEGFVDDKTHGGRFLSVAESTGGTSSGAFGGGGTTQIEAESTDPAQAVAAGFITANVSYLADSQDYQS